MHQLSKLKQTIQKQISQSQNPDELENLRIQYLGKNGELNQIFTQLLKTETDKKALGQTFNQTKTQLEKIYKTRLSQLKTENQKLKTDSGWFDITAPSQPPNVGHLHPVTQAIEEITKIFKHIGFIRVRYPEIDTDWYAAEGLNIPRNHPARDEQETYYIKDPTSNKEVDVDVMSNLGLTPHTSNGQLHEMERIIQLAKKNLKSNNHQLTADFIPIRMINIGKCYRRQIDTSHVPMFHQFEGMVVDKDIAITHLKGTIDYFAKHYFGPEAQSRLRPYNFRFTEPSFEIDFSCTNCNGKGCRLCKEGWLEVGGAGMVHPKVLKNGGINPDKYSGFAFGWGVERVFAIKHAVPDVRLYYQNHPEFLNQF